MEVTKILNVTDVQLINADDPTSPIFHFEMNAGLGLIQEGRVWMDLKNPDRQWITLRFVDPKDVGVSKKLPELLGTAKNFLLDLGGFQFNLRRRELSCGSEALQSLISHDMVTAVFERSGTLQPDRDPPADPPAPEQEHEAPLLNADTAEQSGAKPPIPEDPPEDPPAEQEQPKRSEFERFVDHRINKESANREGKALRAFEALNLCRRRIAAVDKIIEQSQAEVTELRRSLPRLKNELRAAIDRD